MLKFSLIIPYRNRDTEVAKRCITSIKNQKITQDINYEIIFIDYGSDSEKSEEINAFCKKIDSLTYIYTETRGKFWCKPEAINLALNRAKGEYFVTIDVDMIYPSNFLEQLNQQVQENKLVHYQCYYLPENFDYTNYLEKLPTIDTSSFVESDKTCAFGIFAVQTNKLKEIGGFDEYYKMWGMEDKDIHFRLAQTLSVEWLPLEIAPVFHQWHTVSNNPLAQPKGWEKVIVAHYNDKKDNPLLRIHQKNNNEPIGKIYETSQRPSLRIYQDYQTQKINLKSNFEFDFPIHKSYTEFTAKFMKLSANEPLIIHQSFNWIDENSTTTTAKGIKKINLFLEKINLSYRMIELLKYTYGIIDFYEVRDFLFYFLIDFEDFIEDYYYQQENGANGKPEKITLILFKK